MEFHYHKPEPQRALNPVPQQGPYQAYQPIPQNQNPQAQGGYGAPQQHPVVMGQTNTATVAEQNSRWKTAALWIGGVVAATVISYYVQKGLRAHEDYRRNRNPTGGDGGEGETKETKKEELRFVLPNDGSADVLAELNKTTKRLSDRLEDVEHLLTNGETRGKLRK